jgi:hypothetical protein
VSTTSSGNPLWNVVIPLICQPSVTRLGIHSKVLKWRTLGDRKVIEERTMVWSEATPGIFFP